ncbi:MAG TPA: response regulator [Pyrinomonadaceae bacterium]|nr:response regulator [Pyrinomonadaceae bacterium]
MTELNFVPTASSDLCALLQLSTQFQPSPGPGSSRETPGKHPASGESENRRWALVVDDVSDVTEMLSVLMTHAGYEVSTASSAQDAIALAREHHFDVVISDIGMPEMNGYELAKTLRLLPGYDTVPLVAVTGYSMFDDRTRSLTAGFNEHVTKPIDPRAFLELIEQL